MVEEISFFGVEGEGKIRKHVIDFLLEVKVFFIRKDTYLNTEIIWSCTDIGICLQVCLLANIKNYNSLSYWLSNINCLLKLPLHIKLIQKLLLILKHIEYWLLSLVLSDKRVHLVNTGLAQVNKVVVNKRQNNYFERVE